MRDLCGVQQFFVIDGVSQDPTMGAWHLWSVSDLTAAQVARVDLRHLEEDTALAAPGSHAIHQRLQRLQYQIPPSRRDPNSGGSETRAALPPKLSMEGYGA